MTNNFGKDTPESIPGVHDFDMLLVNINTYLLDAMWCRTSLNRQMLLHAIHLSPAARQHAVPCIMQPDFQTMQLKGAPNLRYLQHEGSESKHQKECHTG